MHKNIIRLTVHKVKALCTNCKNLQNFEKLHLMSTLREHFPLYFVFFFNLLSLKIPWLLDISEWTISIFISVILHRLLFFGLSFVTCVRSTFVKLELVIFIAALVLYKIKLDMLEQQKHMYRLSSNAKEKPR